MGSIPAEYRLSELCKGLHADLSVHHMDDTAGGRGKGGVGVNNHEKKSMARIGLNFLQRKVSRHSTPARESIEPLFV